VLLDLLAQPLHAGVYVLPFAVDGGERLRLAGQLFFTITELRQDCLQLPKLFNVLIQQLPPKTKKAFRYWNACAG
jgi:hypothetical protein